MVELLAAAVLLGMVAHRVWRIAARDSITEPVRAWLIDRTTIPAVRWLWNLIDCPWCLGFHLNLAGAAIAGMAYDWHWLEVGVVWFAGSTVTGVVGRGD